MFLFLQIQINFIFGEYISETLEVSHYYLKV